MYLSIDVLRLILFIALYCILPLIVYKGSLVYTQYLYHELQCDVAVSVRLLSVKFPSTSGPFPAN